MALDQSKLLHEWKFTEDSPIIRLYQAVYKPENLNNLTFCRLFWSMVCLPLMSIVWLGILLTWPIRLIMREIDKSVQKHFSNSYANALAYLESLGGEVGEDVGVYWYIDAKDKAKNDEFTKKFGSRTHGVFTYHTKCIGSKRADVIDFANSLKEKDKVRAKASVAKNAKAAARGIKNPVVTKKVHESVKTAAATSRKVVSSVSVGADKVASVFQSMIAWFNAHPKTQKVIVYGTLGALTIAVGGAFLALIAWIVSLLVGVWRGTVFVLEIIGICLGIVVIVSGVVYVLVETRAGDVVVSGLEKVWDSTFGRLHVLDKVLFAIGDLFCAIGRGCQAAFFGTGRGFRSVYRFIEEGAHAVKYRTCPRITVTPKSNA